MSDLRVAGLQMPVTDDVRANADRIVEGLYRARDEGVHVLLTPEGALSGYRPVFDRTDVEVAMTELVDVVRSVGVGLALGTCYEERDGRTYNQLRFLRPTGEHAGTHCKILLCATAGTPPSGEIDDYSTMPLRTFEMEGQPVGGLICNDVWANPMCTLQDDPHLTRQLADLGAKVIFHAVNGGRDGGAWSREVAWPYHEANLRMRARAARVWIVTVDNCAPIDVPCSSPSGVVGPDGEWRVRTDERGPQFFVWTIPLG